MSTYIKTVINNLNSLKYLRNINRVRPADLPIDPTSNNPVTKPASLDEIIKNEEELRHHNLKVYASTYGAAKVQKFFVVSLPALIGAATIASFAVPNHYEKQKSYNMYNVETTTLSSELGQNVETEKCYTTGWSEKTILDQPELKYLSNTSYDEVNFRIYDGTKSIVASINMSSDGSLTVSSVTAEDVIDMSGIENKDYGEIDPKYSQLFDDIIEIIRDSSNLSKSEEEELNRLTSLEKSKIMVQIIEKEKLGKETVTIRASRTLLRVILLVVLVFYLFVEWMILSENGGLEENTPITVGRDGRLSEGGNEEFGFIFGPTKYREIFMRAERDRIIKAWELAKENISLEDQRRIFTHFEKKLIKKYEKNN